MEELQVVIEQQTENEILVVKDYTNLLNKLVATLSDFNEKHKETMGGKGKNGNDTTRKFMG